MTKREKRLEKGIESLEEQKKIHEEKRKRAEEIGEEELVRYYSKEIKKELFSDETKKLLEGLEKLKSKLIRDNKHDNTYSQEVPCKS